MAIDNYYTNEEEKNVCGISEIQKWLLQVCHKSYFTDECEMLEKCIERYCYKTPPSVMLLFCKFSIYCLYKHLLELYKQVYNNICIEVKQLKAEVIALKENVAMLVLKLYKPKSFEDTIF